MKRTMTFLLIVTLVLALPATALAGINILINDNEYTFDPPPMIQEGRTLVPMRAFFESLGADVEWEAETRTAVGTRDGIEVRIPIDSTSPTINGQVSSIDVPAQIFNGRTFIPLRFVGEALGDDVTWDGSTRTIVITSKADIALPPPVSGKLVLHFIDVGQGDSILIETPCETYVLVDAGTRSAGNTVVAYLNQLGVDRLKKVIATHDHADHAGGLIPVYESPIEVVTTYASGYVHDTITAQEFRSLANQHSTFKTATALDTLNLGCDCVEAIFLHPYSGASGDIHYMNLILNVTYNDFSALLTGDAEVDSERAMLGNTQVRSYLPSQVLKVGHHGSRTSTSPEFLTVVSPEVAVIMCGENNRYGHPHQEVLDRLAAAGVKIYRTDISGNIVIHSDGASYDVAAVPFEYTPKPADPAPTPTPGRININAASFEELQEIVHIGPERAREIIRLRPFSSVDGLTRVTGIGPARLRDIKDEGKAYVE